MRISLTKTAKPSKKAILWGIAYLIFDQFLFSYVLGFLENFLPEPLDIIEVNLIFSLTNVTAVVLIFRKYLLQTLREARWRIGPILGYALLAVLGTMYLTELVSNLVWQLNPDYYNVNDVGIDLMLLENKPMVILMTVILAPITEELLFRGLIFRSLFDRSKVLAYLVSMCLFSFIHLTNYISYLDIQWLGLAFLEYLPAAYCLAFAYHNSGSILSPMLVHALVNMLSIGLF